jgi:hypothetical protein
MIDCLRQSTLTERKGDTLTLQVTVLYLPKIYFCRVMNAQRMMTIKLDEKEQIHINEICPGLYLGR